MKKLLLATLIAGAAMVSIAPAEAAQGCGRGFHRGVYGRCVSNGPVYARPRVYWHRYHYGRHPYRWHRGWRYR